MKTKLMNVLAASREVSVMPECWNLSQHAFGWDRASIE